MARGRSSIRTATDSLQASFLARQRLVAGDPAALLPVCIGPEPPGITRLRHSLERARAKGSAPFTARFDRGILGALRTVFELAGQDAAPRLLDAKVDGNRRFYLQRGTRTVRLVNLGVQNHDDPLALMLAYGPIATKAGLCLFAGSELWCTGTRPAPPEQWFRDLAVRTGLQLETDASGARCPHADRARLALGFRDGPALVCCGPCARRAGHLHGHVLRRALCGDQPGRPVELSVRLAAGGSLPVPEPVQDAYRGGTLDEESVLDRVLREWRTKATSEGQQRFVLGSSDFGADQDAFLDALHLEAWERDAVRAMTKAGHVGENPAVADVLAHHRERLTDAVATLLPDDAARFVAAHAGVEARTLIRLAHEEAARRTLTRDLPDVPGLGPLGQWIDSFARQARTLDRARLLQEVRKQVSASPHPAHLYAFLRAVGLQSEGERSFNPEQREAGTHWEPLAKRVLAAKGQEYRDVVLDYLRETGAGETA
ncbi:MAG TPA: hypothetical protein VM286_04875 [Candidatus Thermoplasmatota archaeon]|nr:hypothetical protein [Candidatus Thermoplasmatota archaeon]